MSVKKIKKYFSAKRIISLIVWFVALFAVPSLLLELGILPPGTGFVAVFIFITALFMLLFDKLSFRVGVALSILLAIFSLYKPDFLNRLVDGLNNRMQDTFFQMRGPRKTSGQIAIVDIDERSLDLVGQWPWPRTQIATMIRNLQEDGARVMAFDIVFAEPERYSLGKWIETFHDIGIEMCLPGKTMEESQWAIKNGDIQFVMSGEKLKEFVLRSWKKNFEKEDSQFSADDEDFVERERKIVDKFLEKDRSLWEMDERRLQKRATKLGKQYEPKPYHCPEQPLIEMARRAPQLFFIRDSWNNDEALRKGAPVILDNEAELAEAFSKERVIGGGFFILEQNAGARLIYGDQEEVEKITEGMVTETGIRNAEEIFPFMLVAMEQVLNIPEIQEKLRFQGMFNVIPDKSGAARSYTMLMQAPVNEEGLVLQDKNADPSNPDNYETKIVPHLMTYPSITLQMLRVANGYDYVEAIERADGQRGIVLKRLKGFEDRELAQGEDPVSSEEFSKVLERERFVPLDFKGDVRINYLGYGGPWKPGDSYDPDYYFIYVSLADVLFKRFEPGTFKDKYVFIGSTDPTLSDLVGNPFRAAFPGLEVHATMLDNLIKEDYLLDLGDKTTLYIFIGLLIGGLILSALISYSGHWQSGVYLAFVLFGLPILSYFGFSEYNVVIEFVYPWSATLLIGIVVILVNFFVEGKEKRFLNSTFKNYLSPELIDQMISSGTKPQLGGQEGFITAYFTDIASFSTFSEKIGSPTRLVELLNEYLSAMTDILIASGGTLDKYEGDAIIAFYGAPMPLENHAKSALKGAIQMQQQLGQLRKKWTSEGDKWPTIVHHMRMRIGINSGRIVTGNMGSTLRMNYTMMGDAVNLAARLESGAKQYGAYTVCSLETLKAAGDGFVVRCIDKLRVMGKTEPVQVYEVLANKEEASPDLNTLVEKFQKAREYYERMEWDTAITLFEECVALEPNHPDKELGCKITPSQLFIKRCREYKKEPPVSEGVVWDGVHTATEK